MTLLNYQNLRCPQNYSQLNFTYLPIIFFNTKKKKREREREFRRLCQKVLAHQNITPILVLFRLRELPQLQRGSWTGPNRERVRKESACVCVYQGHHSYPGALSPTRCHKQKRQAITKRRLEEKKWKVEYSEAQICCSCCCIALMQMQRQRGNSEHWADPPPTNI